MSVLTTTARQSFPNSSNGVSAAGLSVAAGVGAYVFGDWVEFIASAATALQLEGVAIGAVGGTTWANAKVEIQFGVNVNPLDPTDFTEIGLLPVLLVNSGTGAPTKIAWPAVFDLITITSSLSVRIRANLFLGGPLAITLQAFGAWDGTTGSTGVMTGAPLGQDAPALVPNGTPGAWSAYVQLTTGPVVASGLIGLAVNPTFPADFEFELARGNPGSEIPLTVLPASRAFAGSGTARIQNLWLNAMYPVNPNVPISVRVRTTATIPNPVIDVPPLGPTLIYYEGVTIPVPPPPVPLVRRLMRRVRRFPLPYDRDYWTTVHRIEFYIQSGVGLISGQGSNPLLEVRFSQDGGKTWGNILLVEMGEMGQYDWRPVINNLGKFRNGWCEIADSDPVESTLIDCYVDVSQSRS